MATARRDRDRPKHAPTSLYNPNKRVLLQYDSDEEGDLQNTELFAPLEDNAAADYTIPEYPDSEGEEGVQKPSLESGKQHSGNGEAKAPEPATPANVDDDEDGPRSEAPESTWVYSGKAKNQSTGQWPALGSVAYAWEDQEEPEDFESDEDEAMAYLRGVRSERRTMPEILRASRPTSDEDIYNSGRGDHRGVLDDGAYYARVSLAPSLADSAQGTIDPQEAFTRALKRRFYSHRQQLLLHPSAEAVAALHDRHPISFPQANNKAYADWHRLLRGTPPQLAQMQSLEQSIVFRLLELLQKHFLKREKEINSTTSAWIWALLARLDDVGTMDNDQVWILRDFGKKAVLVQLSFDNPMAAETLERESAVEDDSGVILNETATGLDSGAPNSAEIKLDEDAVDSKAVGPETKVRSSVNETSLSFEHHGRKQMTAATMFTKERLQYPPEVASERQ
ncbi:uncharacterized protein LTR77_009925 [Saxophila tyrrhenica]|uniref:Uncharacterized protein n=1 Tax=Saxophila tyrrhenica TaxID=1690608 RepID=A0AAV9NWP7_9PEZI|nr:hypothetical protein LTR77_009925 [Saxophila tyrrhenica]